MALQHLRSGTANKRPIPTVMSAGQIAVNTNEASPGLFFKDSNGDLVKVGPVHIGTSAPNSSPASTAATALVSGTVYQILTVGTTDFTAVGASANTIGVIFTASGAGTGTGTVSGQQGVEKGEQWLDTTGGNYVLKIYDGTAWRSEAGEFVNVTGDTMTGALLLDNAASASAPDLSFDGDANTGVFSPGADQFAIATAGAQRIVVDSSGHVGIGSTTPSSYNVSADNLVVQNSDGTGAAGITIRAGTGSQSTLYFADGTGVSDAIRGYVQYFHNGDFLRFGTDANERFRIDSNGRCLLGTTTEGYATLADKLTIADAGHCGMTIRSGSSHNGSIYFSDATSGTDEYDGYIEYQHTNRRFLFGTAQSNRVTIDSDGKLGVGATEPSVLLHIAATEPQFYIQDSNSTGNNVNATLQFRDSSNTQLSYFGYASGSDSHLSLFNTMSGGNLRFGTESNERLTITSGGNVGINTSAPDLKLEISGGQNQTANQFTDLFRIAANANNDGAAAEMQLNFGISPSHTDTANRQARIQAQTAGGTARTLAINPAGGNVGIGATDPSQILELKKGEPRLCINATSASADLGIEFEANGTRLGHIFHNHTSGEFDISCGENTGGSHFMTFKTGNGSEKMRLDSSGRLMLGTTDEATNAEVTVRAASPQLSLYATPGNVSRITLGDTDDWNIGQLGYDNSDNSMFFSTNNETRMTLDFSGRLGLGTQSPTSALYINSATNAYVLQNRTNCQSIIGPSGPNESDGVLVGSVTNSPFVFWINSGEKGRMDTSGRLNIGTTSGNDNRPIHIHTASSGGSYFHSTNDGTGETATDGIVLGMGDATNAYIWNYESGAIQFGTSNAAVMTIESSGFVKAQKGYLYVQKDSGTGNADGVAVICDGNADAYLWNYENTTLRFGTNNTEVMRLSNTGQASFYSTGNPITSGTSQGAGTTYEVFTGVYSRSSTTSGGTVSINIYSNGDIKNTNNIYGQISDAKLKENIVDAGSQWEDFKAVRFRKYNFKEETGYQTHTQLGVVAQELELTSPGLVYETADKDEDGNDLGTTTKAVKSSILTQKALVALQEAMARIETLEAKVAALEAG